MRRRFLIGLVALILPIVILLALAETALWFLPVSSGLLAMPVTTESPVFHFTPNRNFVFSRDWDLALVNHGRINNAGWINDQDYRDRPDRPLLAVIGDSYIEASIVPYGDTCTVVSPRNTPDRSTSTASVLPERRSVNT